MSIIQKINLFSRFLVRYKGVLPKMKVNMAQVIQTCEEFASTKAAEFLARGQVIAVPTDTIYGLACSANCPDAIKKLYTIKGRDSMKPVAICVSYITDLRKWGEAEHLGDDLLHNLLPGPVTVVLEKTRHLNNPFLNPGTTKIGIRIPQHSFVNDFTQLFDMPVALTSANFSNEPSTLSTKEFTHLFGHLGAVFDGGILSQGLDQNRTGSTVIDLSQPDVYTIIRKGISYDRVIEIVQSYGLRKMV